MIDIPRRELMYNQITMNYRQYIYWYLDELQEAYREYIDTNWKDRTDDDYKMMNKYTSEIKLYQGIVDSFRRLDNDKT